MTDTFLTPPDQVSREYLAKAAEALPGTAALCGVNGIPVGRHIRDDEQVGEGGGGTGSELAGVAARLSEGYV